MLKTRDARGGEFRPRAGRGKGKIHGAGRGKKMRKSTDFGQNWILPNFNGFKSTLPRCAPHVLVIFEGAGRGGAKTLFFRGGAGRASLVLSDEPSWAEMLCLSTGGVLNNLPLPNGPS